MDLLINIDVPCLARGIEFYENAFGLTVTRRLGAEAAELSGWPARLYLLEKQAGSVGADNRTRHYDRHWTPLHLDVVVDDIQMALTRAVAAGARAETEVRLAPWGKHVVLADPFGHGLCLIEFVGRGYDEIASRRGEGRRTEWRLRVKQGRPSMSAATAAFPESSHRGPHDRSGDFRQDFCRLCRHA